MDKQENITYIGQVSLDYTWYPGEDLYSDGEVEEKLLHIAGTSSEEELNAVIAQEKDWAVLYHMSHIRENIISAFPFRGDEQVLEIGSGCGAVTGALLKGAAHVTGIDLSSRRSRINALRHADADNLSLIVGNFRDIEPHLPEYDVITLIGVFEYAKAYMGTENPYGDFLRLICAHLKDDGVLVIAIENRLGLKYWAGCAEDHTGRYFDGLENYPSDDGSARTFSRAELIRLFQEADLTFDRFYYPYPDYKLPMSVYSDSCMPKEGQLRTNRWNFDRKRLRLFDEDKVFDSLVQEDQFAAFSNSFLVMLRKKSAGPAAGRQIEYTRFSNERSRRFALRTDIFRDEDGVRSVSKTACYAEGKQHICHIARMEKELTRLFAPAQIAVNRVTGLDEEKGSVCLEYLSGRRSLEEEAAALIRAGEEEKGREKIRAWCGLLDSLAVTPFAYTGQFGQVFGCGSYDFADRTLTVTDLDMTAENLLTGDPGVLIDYEWTYDFPVPLRFVLFRIWYYFAARNIGEGLADEICRQEGFSSEEIQRFLQMEKAWQGYITKGHTPLRELYACVSPGEISVPGVGSAAVSAFVSHLYYASDESGMNGSLTSMLHMEEDGKFSVSFDLTQLPPCSRLRWDPLEGSPCRLRIERVAAPRMAGLNPANGFRGEDLTDTFWTSDPAYELTGTLPSDGYLTIEGTLSLIDLMQELECITTLNRERDAYYQEMESLRARIGAIRGTKAYKATEGLRRIRNFTMARVRGTKMFRDKNAGPKKYQQWLQTHLPDAATLEAQKKMVLPDAPMISVLVPVYRTDPVYLRAMLDSVLAQSYGNWELCIADGSMEEAKGPTGEILRSYAEREERIKVRTLEKNEGISCNTNEAAKLAGGRYLALLDHDDLLAPNALFEVAQAIAADSPEVLYTDEDKINMMGTDHFEPNLKPDFSPDLLRSHNYITHLFVVRRDLFEQVGGFRKEFDGAQDYDLILRCCEKAEKICHIPKILYHWRSHPLSTAQVPESKTYAYEAGRKAVAEHLERMGLRGEVRQSGHWGIDHVVYDVPDEAFVSVIIPNKDHVRDLDRCLVSLFENSHFRRFEVIVVENNSAQKETFAYYRKARNRWKDLRIVRWEKPFNYAAINNYGASFARGNYLLLLNNDTQLLDPDSIREMAGLCSVPGTGCVGAKLLYPNDTVQHAGIVLGFGGFAGHVFVGIGKDSPGFMMRPLMVCNYSAVTAACLMVRKEIFDEVGGLDERYAVALNDVDFCLKVRRAGYRNIYTPWSLWHHFESATRGYEDTPEKKERFEREIKQFQSDWADMLSAPDPFYNPNFSLDHAPFSLW